MASLSTAGASVVLFIICEFLVNYVMFDGMLSDIY